MKVSDNKFINYNRIVIGSEKKDKAIDMFNDFFNEIKEKIKKVLKNLQLR